MYYLIAEFSNYRQLMKLFPEDITDITGHARILLEQDGGVFQQEEGGFFLFAFPSLSKEDEVYLGDTIFRLKRYLREKENDLYGYTVLIDYCTGGHREDIFTALKGTVLRIEADESFWLGKSAAGSLKNRISTRRQGAVWKILSRMEGKNVFLGAFREFVVHPEIVENLLDEMTPLINGEAGKTIVFLKGSAPLEMHLNLYAALEKITGKRENEGWVTASLPGGNEVFSSVEPFRNALRNSLFPEIASFLNDTEKQTWKRLEPLLIKYGSGTPVLDEVHDIIRTDFISAFLLYLTGFSRMVRNRYIPFFLVCEELEQYKDETLDILVKTVLSGVPEEDFFPCMIIPFTSEEVQKKVMDRLPSVQPGVSYDVKVLEYKELEGVRISKYLSSKLRGKPEILKFYTDLKGRESLETVYYRILSGKETGKTAFRSQVFANLNPVVRTTAFAAVKCTGMIREEQFHAFMKTQGIELLAVQNSFRELEKFGFIKNGAPFPREITSWMKEKFPEETEKIIQALSDWIYSEWVTGNCIINIKTIQLLRSSRKYEHFLKMFQRYIFRSPSVGGASVIRDVLYYYPGLKINKSRYAWEFNMLQKGGKLRCALLDRDRNAAARHSHQWKTGREEQSYFAGDFCFLRGKYLLAEWKLSGAMEMIKRSIMLYQAGDDASGLCRANAELGIVMLGQKNLQDAKNYFGIARKSVDPSRDISAYLRSYILEIISLFLQGNYTRVLDYLPSIKETAESISVRKWFLYLSFLEGRTYMELGRYTEAENLFSLGMTYCRIYRDPEALEVLYRWFARAMIYNGKIHEGLFILKDRVRTRESLFFMAEAYTLLGEHRLGFSAAREALDLSRNHIFFTTEPVPWENGFSFMEDLTMEDEKEERVLDRFIRALSGYLKAVVQDFDEGIEDMKRLTRGRHQWELDPFWSIYYFLYAELLPEAGDGRFEDKVTVLGKSVKFFQERSSRIDRFTDKNSFMKQNYWNSRILKSAKEHNLV